MLGTHRGNTINLAGKKLHDALPLLKREVIDALIEVSFKGTSKAKKDEDHFEVYHPKGGAPKVKETFRLVGVLDEETKTYHLYFTNITPDQISAEDVAL